MELDKKICPVLNVDGFIEKGKQFDLNITLPEDERNVIYGVIKDCHGCPVKDAVVKLIEVVYDCGRKERKPVSHTFTDGDGEFVFGPLCPDKYYDLNIWVNKVKHFKMCSVCKKAGTCLKGVDMDCCEMNEIKEKEEKCEEDNKCCNKNNNCR